MNRDDAHRLVDALFAEEAKEAKIETTSTEVTHEPKRELPEDKRVVRTKSTGDRVYLVDEKEKTKAWITSPEILEKLGFTMADVQDVEDKELLGYQMTASVYKVD